MFLCDFSTVPSLCPPLGGESDAFVGVGASARVDVRVCGSVQSPVPCLHKILEHSRAFPILDPSHQQGMCRGPLGMVHCGEVALVV